MTARMLGGGYIDPLFDLIESMIKHMDGGQRVQRAQCPGAASGCNYPESECAGVCHGN